MLRQETGTCPTCDGKAIVYPFYDGEDKGHVYCDEDDCGWIHRGLIGVSEFMTTAPNP
jgi:hypothetical protein